MYSLEFDYTRLNDVMMVIKQYNCSILQQEVQLFYNMKIGIPQNRLEEVLFKLKELHNVGLQRIL